MKIQIKHRFTEAIIYEGDHRSMRAAVVAAVKSGADLSEAELSLADFSGAILWDANLSRADLSDANLSFTNLSDANLSFATLSDTDLSNANLSRAELSGADLSDANLSDANLSGAELSGADLSDANLSDANLSGANLSFANLSGANLSDASLADATMPGFADRRPKSLREAAELTKEWLRDGHWLQGAWIDTPTAAYEEDCLACLHGAAVYCGGEFGPELSKAMNENGYTVEWNDKDGRTIDEIVAAFDAVIPKLEAINS